MKTLEGKVAVITGGSSGIGLATAKRFVDEGAHVVITGRREKELKEAAAFIKRNVTTVVGDVSRLEDLDRLYAVVKEKHGHIDILFANAGAGTIGPLAVAAFFRQGRRGGLHRWKTGQGLQPFGRRHPRARSGRAWWQASRVLGERR